MKFFYFSLLIATLTALCSGQDNPCRREAESSACLDHISTIAEDRDRFWFGNDYKELCTGNTSLECLNPIGRYNNSIVSLLFGDDTSALDDLDRFVHVHFETEELTYRGCGTEVTQPAAAFELDLSLQEHLPATVRNKPEVVWDYAPGDMFTLMLVDPGFYFLHALHINIEGADLTTGEVITEYSGPGNFRFTPNAYVFMIFKQPDRIVWSDLWDSVVENGVFVTNLYNFRDEYALTGPVAMNIAMVTTDIYAVSRLERIAADSIQYCSVFVERALRGQEEEFLPDVIRLNSTLRVNIRSEELEATYCCEDHFFPARLTRVDPLGRELVRAADVRTGSQLELAVNITGVPPVLGDYIDRRFLLLVLDPDVVGLPFADARRPLLHHLAFDMQLDALTSYSARLVGGTVAVEYFGPLPPDDEPHTYYFLLYSQPPAPLDLQEDDLDRYRNTDTCPPNLEGRCYFEVERFARENSLTLVGASWMVVGNDDFVDFMWELDQEEYCERSPPCATPRPPTAAPRPTTSATRRSTAAPRPTTDDPLPPSAANGLVVSVMTLLFASVLAMFF